MSGKVVVRQVARLTDTIQEGMDALGYRPCHPEVVLKPNVLKGLRSGSGNITSMPVMRALITVLNRSFSLNKIYVAESSYMNADTTQAFRLAGYFSLEDEFPNVRLVDLKKEDYLDSEFKFRVPRILDGKCLVDVPVLKGHAQVGLTCAVKNLKGLLTDIDKKNAHLTGLDHNLTLLPKLFKPCLVVADATTCLETHGGLFPKKFRFNRVLFGTDPVAVDHACCQMVGINVSLVKYLDMIVQERPDFAYEIDGKLDRIANWNSFRDCIAVGRMRIYIDSACSKCWDAAIESFNPGFLSESRLERIWGMIGGGFDCFVKRGRVNLVVGDKHAVVVERLEGKTILIGNCAMRRYGALNLSSVKGCPPDATAIRETTRRSS